MTRESFPSDLTDDQWAAVEPLIPPPAAGGRKRQVNPREVVNAIRYLRATNCGWRKLPNIFPNRSTVRHYYDAWRERGVWEEIESALAFARGNSNAPQCDSRKESPKPSNGTS
jgi:putative transposase